MLELVKSDDPILKTPCPEFDFEAFAEECDPTICTSFEYLRNLVSNIFEVMYANNGMGLAAPQVGLNYRLFIMRVNKEEFICINPKIIAYGSEDVVDLEGCLSFPELRLNVKRPDLVNVSYQLVDGTEVNRDLGGLISRCFQHELDHLNGITFDSKVSKFSLRRAKEKRNKLLKKQLRGSS